MSQAISVYEILEYAIEREVQAYNFYTTLAKQMAKTGMRSFLNRLAGQELEHKARLEMEMVKLGKVVAFEDNLLEIELDYSDDSPKNGIDLDFADAVKVAVSKESASFQLYATLGVSAEDEDSREMFFQLAEEEVCHKLLLEDAYGEYLDGKDV